MSDFVLPPWNAEDRVVHGESCLFALNDKARLLFPARSVQCVWCPETGVVYRPGKDYLFEPGNDFLTRPEGSAIPFLSETELYPPDENCVFYPNAGSNAIRGKVNGGNIRFSPTDGYAKIQFEVDYTARRIDFLPVDTHAQQERLPRFRKMLDSGEKLRVTLLGDSISEGKNASGNIGVPPFQPSYVELIRQALAARHPGELVFHNRAVSGTGCRHGLTKILEDWKKDSPDLLILAYGMNDFRAMEAEEFLGYNLELIAHAREVNPASEILMVIPMAGNPEWERTKPGKDEEFAQIVRQYWRNAGPAFAVADVRAVWMKIMQRKSFYALTGNGVNHPNDFGHRVYAATVLSVLIPAR